MYKWVQEPGVVARFTKGGVGGGGRGGKLISALGLRKEHRLLGLGVCTGEINVLSPSLYSCL